MNDVCGLAHRRRRPGLDGDQGGARRWRRPASRAVGAAGRGRRAGERVEHDPATLAGEVVALLEELAGRGPLDAVALTCQRSTCLLWERVTGRPLTGALSWQDRRAVARVAPLGAAAAAVAARTGLHLSPHYAAPKLGWLLERLPDGARRAAAGELVAGTLDAFLVQALTGTASTEPGQAGRTLLCSLDEGTWDPWLLELFGLPGAALPPLAPSVGVRGSWRGVPLVALAGDQQAALVGHGGAVPGVVAAHFGTGAFVLAAVGALPLRRPGLLAAWLYRRGEERAFQLEGAVNSAGSAVDWALRITGIALEAAGAVESCRSACPGACPPSPVSVPRGGGPGPLACLPGCGPRPPLSRSSRECSPVSRRGSSTAWRRWPRPAARRRRCASRGA